MISTRTSAGKPAADNHPQPGRVSAELGYSTLLALDSRTPVACILVPFASEPTGAAIEGTTLTLSGGATRAVFRGLPAGLIGAISSTPEKVFILCVDTLTEARFVSSAKSLFAGEPGPQNPEACRSGLNTIMTAAASSSTIVIRNYRLLSRHHDTEAFVRKLIATFRSLAPSVSIDAAATDLDNPQRTSGPLELSKLACAALGSALPAAKYLPFPGTAQEGTSTDRLKEFALLHTAAYGHLAQAAANGPTLAASAASVAIEMAGAAAKTLKVASAIDSVFIKSFCDAHALLTIAATQGVGPALSVLQDVRRKRTSTGDLGVYSGAPLSHDTSASLSIVQAQLDLGGAPAGKTSSDLVGMAMWMAADGVDVWMQDRGVEATTARSICTTILRIFGWAGHRSFRAS